MALGAGVLIWIVLKAHPEVLVGGFIGGVVGGAVPWSFADSSVRRHWKANAAWSIGAGIAVATAYLLLDAPLGVLGEGRRFDRRWEAEGIQVAPFIEHPWAWLPPAAGVALVVAGIAVWWRASR